MRYFLFLIQQAFSEGIHPPLRFTGNQLKLLAVLAMISQHTAILFLSPGTAHNIMYEFGRLTAPIMCFFIAEGYIYTHSLRKYLFRLFLLARISHIPHALAFGFPISDVWHATSILWGLFLGLVALAAARAPALSLIQKIFMIAGCCFLSYPANFNLFTVLWILCFGLLSARPLFMWSTFALLVLLYASESFVVRAYDTPMSRLWFLLSIPVLLCYNGQRGRQARWCQWGYYLIYPVHFLVLHGLRLAL